DGLSEQEAKQLLFGLSQKNANAQTHQYFLGAGVYNHYIPAAVWALASRGEFLTSYTPYQPEISQGMLQSIFEWQTCICELTGMEATNASTYDGAEALAEAVLMARNMTKKTRLLVSKAINPEYLAVARTYASANNLVVEEIAFENGVTSVKELREKTDSNVAGVFVQHPNFFGALEPLSEIGKIARENGAVFVVSVNELVSLGLLKPPSEFGADIVCGEAQSFGIPMSFGGPHCGFISVKMKDVRQLPGRIVGETVDLDGKRGYIMTLQAREQHIRREKANSNLCTNQALFALAATIHLTLLGKQGVKKLANANAQLAHYALEQFLKAGAEPVFGAPFFNEFVVKVGNAQKVQERLLGKNIFFGFALEKVFPQLKGHLLVCVTELNSRQQVDELALELKGALQ
ncbi:MAG: aminomethyl-transferring glycine dehydrogenase subunit GcvPA, partial [archaeon]